ncbi:hypothetical protein K503DRAFT_711169 [Rhizopogon vinicolor AM-OR11-026]|uniref:Uncharacterized protein n=1 Tax=Rhizopogon vinicolor AM-OR11-026 TaxID=1314800 RepID=A0A1B7NBC8_9AGAM|nr:hypothetical protein K503DRAFT_711169 [Rhizopogon vinicolor AM-OR11-026]
MEDGTNDLVVADSEDEEGFQPLADQSGLLSGDPFSTGTASISERSIIQTATFSTSPVRTPQRASGSPDISNASLFTPPPGYKESELTDTSPLLSRVAGTFAPKPKPRPRPIPRKSRTTSSVFDQFANEDTSRTSGSLISPTSAFAASTSVRDSIHPPTTCIVNASSEFIEDINPTLNIADRAKTRSRRTQARKPTYVPVDVDVIELTSDSDADELSLKPSRKRHKSQDEPVKPKPKPRPKPKPKSKKLPSLKLAEPVGADTHSPETAAPPVPQEHPFPSPTTVSHLPSSLAPLPDLSSPPSSPFVINRKRKRALPLEPDVHAEDMNVDDPSGSLPSITEPPLFFAPSPSVVLPMDDSNTLEEDTRSINAIATASKGTKKKNTKPSAKTKGKKGRKKTDEVELDELAQKSPQDNAATGNDNLAEDDFVEKEAPKVASKKRAPPKPKTKPKAKGKGKAILSESENEEEDPPPRSKLPIQCNQLPEDDESLWGSPKKDSCDAETSKDPPQTACAPPKQTPSASHLRSRAFTIKPKSTPMSELIRRVNSQPNSPFSNGPSYSPLVKSSRTMLSRIAPLHPNRRTPPPPLPRPPPQKKSKKQIEMEERIEEELSETVEGWSCMTDEERRSLRRARIDAEMGYE